MSEDFKLTWLPKKTFEITIIIAWKEINQAREKTIEKIGETLEIKGFRKGKSPKNLILEKVGPQKITEEALNLIVPDKYSKAVLKLGLHPIATPKIELVSAKENQDWTIKFTSCEAPDVNLGTYKQDLSKIKSAPEIWKPGDKSDEKNKKSELEQKEEKLQKAVNFLLENIKVDVSDLLLEQEVNHKLSQLLEQTQKLGITIDQYLSSTGKTLDSLKQEYQKTAARNLAFEFILQKISETEGIQITPEEIEKAVSGAKNDEEKKELESKKYFLAGLLRQQKTLDFLADLL